MVWGRLRQGREGQVGAEEESEEDVARGGVSRGTAYSI